MGEKWPKRYRSVHSLAAALAGGDIPANVVSPGAAAMLLHTTRGAVHQQIRRGTLRAWVAEGVVLVDAAQAKRKGRVAQGIPETQGELLDAT